jgi:nuclear transport factor 2 (NTF2) superfamily protein
MKNNNNISGGENMHDPDIIYLSNRIDSLEKNQIEILEILKQTVSHATHPELRAFFARLPNERRTQQRKQISVPISYEYSLDNGTISRSGKSFNISETGMCFYTQTPLREGLNLRVQSEHIWDTPKTGIVKWCNRKYLNFYQVGISFQ